MSVYLVEINDFVKKNPIKKPIVFKIMSSTSATPLPVWYWINSMGMSQIQKIIRQKIKDWNRFEINLIIPKGMNNTILQKIFMKKS